MRKVILLFMVVLATVLKAATTTDRVYTSDLQQESGKYYIVVYLEGTNFYTGYGLDIQLPQGLEVTSKRGGIPSVEKFDNEMYEDAEGDTEHAISSSYPNSSDHSHIRVGCMSAYNWDMAKTSGALFRIWITNNCTDSQWPLGLIKLYDVELNKVGSAYNPESDYAKVLLMNEGDVTLPLNISSSVKWGTCILPFSCALPSGVKAYTCNSKDEENLLLTEVPHLAAYTPYILYSEAGYSGNLSGTVDANEYPADGFVKSGYLSGAIVPQVVKDGYVLQNLPLKEGVKFYSCNGEDYNIPAGKCWVKIDGSSARERFGFAIDNSQTGISKVNVASDKVLYSISGVRMSDTTAPGFYIVNGKKVLKY